MARKLIAIKDLGRELQSRSLDEETVAEYTEQLVDAGPDKHPFPDVVGFKREVAYGQKLTMLRPDLVDGFHRVAAYERAGRAKIWVDLREGTHEEAFRFACGANTNHGKRRTNADKRYSVDVALKSPVFCEMSDRKLADLCDVSDRLVAKVRRENACRGANGSPPPTQLARESTSETGSSHVEPPAHASSSITRQSNAVVAAKQASVPATRYVPDGEPAPDYEGPAYDADPAPEPAHVAAPDCEEAPEAEDDGEPGWEEPVPYVPTPAARPLPAPAHANPFTRPTTLATMAWLKERIEPATTILSALEPAIQARMADRRMPFGGTAELREALSRAVAALREWLPACECWGCEASGKQGVATCVLCKGQGWLSAGRAKEAGRHMQQRDLLAGE